MFDELMKTKKIEEPEARQAEEIQHSKKELRAYKKRKSSVSVTTLNWSLRVVTIIGILAVAAVIIGAIYYAFSLYFG